MEASDGVWEVYLKVYCLLLLRMGVFGVEVVATDMKAATAAAKKVPCRRPFWWVSIADSFERRLWMISGRSHTIIAWKRW